MAASDKRIVYVEDDGTLAVIVPADECGLTIEEIQTKDVPEGKTSYIVDVSEVLVNVGAGVFVNKSVPDAQKTISTQVDLSNKYFEQINMQLQMLNQQAAALQGQSK